MAVSVIQGLDPSLQLMILVAAMALLPFVVASMTSFLRYVIVFSILKTAMGTQQVPPAIVLVGMALILTMYTMSPIFSEMYTNVMPQLNKKNTDIITILDKGSQPLKNFMMRQTRQSDIQTFLELSRKNGPPKGPEELTLWEVAPAFMLSELRTSFEIGFIIFIPFVLVDLVVSNVLLALGMMMLSPTIISLPFKILIFIAVDGWGLIVNGLVRSFN
jgi:flagellar biosynthesis protein FliP